MKLSDLEKLVKAMREQSQLTGVDDPNVEFWEFDRGAFAKAMEDGAIFLNMEPLPSVLEELGHHTVKADGSAAKRGDFCIPMRLV